MSFRIKDSLAPELYDYYKLHRNKYRKFASDLPVLQAQLFKDMMAEGEFHSKPRKYGWEYEKECVEWLDKLSYEKHIFDDFRKLYRDILKNYKYKSQEYYEQCERIVKECISPNHACENYVEAPKQNVIKKSSPMVRTVSVVNDKPKAINVRDYLITDCKENWRADKHLRINGCNYAMPSSQDAISRCRNWAILNIKRDATFEDFCEYFKEELSLYWIPGMSYSERATGRFYTACYILTIDNKFQPKPKAPKVVGTRSIDALFEDNKYNRAKSYDERTKECQNYLKYYFLGMVSYPVLGFWLYLLKDIIHAVLAYIGFSSSVSLEIFGMIFANSYEDNMFKGVTDGTLKSLEFDSTVAWEHSMIVIGVIYIIIYAAITIIDGKRLGILMKAFWIKGELDDVLE